MHMEDSTRCRLVDSLGGWNFEPHKLPDEEVLACSYILFEALYRIEGMQDAIGLPLSEQRCPPRFPDLPLMSLAGRCRPDSDVPAPSATGISPGKLLPQLPTRTRRLPSDPPFSLPRRHCPASLHPLGRRWSNVDAGQGGQHPFLSDQRRSLCTLHRCCRPRRRASGADKQVHGESPPVWSDSIVNSPFLVFCRRMQRRHSL